ncbi:lantibiotic dehydratase [Sorangium sp. So ce1389]|uniref:lantibiotic dehydratase n=1 Tax=Sorangium sp. So ce1389 TaxID=3133336 RepID=UPI003F600EB4
MARRQRGAAELVAGDFFVLRTPLLPADELASLGQDLLAPRSSGGDLEAAHARDRRVVRERLWQALARGEVREALALASPSLAESADAWRRDPDGERGQKAERALLCYFLRMAGRPTPFGLFAGCSTGRIGGRTDLRIAGRGAYERRTRLDADYLDELSTRLARDPFLSNALRYRPNSSLYRAAGQLRYVEVRLHPEGRGHRLTSIESTPYLDAVLARAEQGADRATLLGVLAAFDPEAGEGEASEYLDELIAGQVLVADLGPALTGRGGLEDLIEALDALPGGERAAALLGAAREALRALDEQGLGHDPGRYNDIAALLSGLPAQARRARLFQVDLFKPAPEATLGPDVLSAMTEGVEVLRRLSAGWDDGLSAFRERFRERYEDREVPLMDALDEESGIGFPDAARAPAPPPPWLLRKLLEATSRREMEIALGAAEVAALPLAEPAPLPDALAVVATIVPAAEEGPPRVALAAVGGPSGAYLLGRFCAGSAELEGHVRGHLRAEEAMRPEAVFAEIVHQPTGRSGNVLSRPVLRSHEIVYLGRSGAAPDRQLPITDLLVSVRAGRVVLRSARLGQEVLPRLTTAHVYTGPDNLALYRFLGCLQVQGAAASPAWSWGSLDSAPFLPRVVSGRAILAPARWNLAPDQLAPLWEARGAARYSEAQALRSALRWPRHVALCEGDQLLPLDLDNPLCIEVLAQLSKGQPRATLVEAPLALADLCAHGPEGRYVHEVIVPFLRSRPREARPEPAGPGPRLGRGAPPGSEWLYAKLYAGRADADRLLRDVVAGVVSAARSSGAADRWFFVRYGDPDWHVRLRLRGSPERLITEVLPALRAAAAAPMADGTLWRLQLDTYEPELERYGGAEGVDLAERLFMADSEAVLALLLLDDAARADDRSRLAVRSSAALLDALGLDSDAQRALLADLAQRFRRELRPTADFERQLGARYRAERPLLERAMAARASDPAEGVLRRRGAALAGVAGALRESAPRLGVELPALSGAYLHMHVNRLLRAPSRAEELRIYDFLLRLRESQAARARPSTGERS